MINNVSKLHAELKALYPVTGVSSTGQLWFTDTATDPEKLAAAAYVTTFVDVPTPPPTLAEQNLDARAAAKLISTTVSTPDGKVLRALAAILVDEINIVRAGLPTPLGARTLTQFKNAIAAKLDGGTVD